MCARPGWPTWHAP
ncbi:thiol reductant ABC exporter subunit CydD, partial [Stenotrophomonas maltophilia]